MLVVGHETILASEGGAVNSKCIIFRLFGWLWCGFVCCRVEFVGVMGFSRCGWVDLC